MRPLQRFRLALTLMAAITGLFLDASPLTQL
jgi:hypothetical protein